MNNKKLILSLLICAIGYLGNAQQTDYSSLTKNLLLEHQEKWALTDNDIKDYQITDVYTSKHNGVTHIYVQQLHNGIPLFNAVSNFNLKNGKSVIENNNHVSDLKSKINSDSPKLSPTQALEQFANKLEIKYDQLPALLKQSGQHKNTFAQASFTKSNIPVNLVYFQDRSGDVHLAWNLEVQMNTSNDYWNGIIDANTGELIANYNQTLYCKFEEGSFGRQSNCNDHNHTHNHVTRSNSQSDYSAADGATYRVYQLPVESPIHGTHSLVESPAFDFASPFGWHDVDGVEGPEYTITRGNNVWAYEDLLDEDESKNNEPDGGENLQFDFAPFLDAEPDAQKDAVITNLFYVSNYVHDWSYYFGFDELAGNFQVNNYGKGGNDNDEIQANGLDGEDIGNANFSLTRDGRQSFLQMYQWTGDAGNTFLTIDEPASISGPLETGGCAFCPAVTSVEISGKVVITSDASGNRTDGCQEIINVDEVAGNVALIDRGGCFFTEKMASAESAGAIAAIICNYENGITTMGGDDQVGIPGLFLDRIDCDVIRASIANGEDVVLRFQAIEADESGPELIPGSYDNGIIAHEYGHGISSRLTGGPNTICLFNDEEMGEGWSDFIGLVLTHEPGDKGTDIRGIGNYVATGDVEGRGIRRKPYSTDFAINDHTYNNIRSSSLIPHNLGEVWGTMIWDLYWAFVDMYGFNPDWTDKESGNYKAVQLVIDGLKLQGCSPGFVKGRNGILAADEVLFDGEHECMIWDVFAKRGLGFYADQGSANDRNDNSENFDVLPSCIKEIKITKEMTEVIDAGNDIEVELEVINHKEDAVTGTVVTDIIPDGASYLEGSANVDAIVNGNSISFSLGTMDSQAEQQIRYVLKTDTDESISLLKDDFESATSELIPFPITGDTEWTLTQVDAFRGETSQFIANEPNDLDQGLVTIQPIRISGDRPTLSFRHKYSTEFFFDGGIVEISTDDGASFNYLPGELFLKGGYDTQLDFFTFALPDTDGFSGPSGGWKVSYIDLSDYIGQEVLIRFRFGCDDAPTAADPDRPTQRINTVPNFNTGWFIDNFEIVDLTFLDGNNAIVTTNEGDQAEAGDITVVNSEFTTPTNEVTLQHDFVVFPNPTQDRVYVNFSADRVGQGKLQLLDLTGKLVVSQEISIRETNSHIMDIKELTSGAYLLQVILEESVLTEKLIIEN